MKQLAAIAVAALWIGSAAAADQIEGVWQTDDDDGAFAHVTIAPCGDGFCGTISRTFNRQGEFASPNQGRQIVRDMVPNGADSYEGVVWRPSNGKTYIGKVDLDGDRMALRGCITGGLICARQNWTRVR